MHTILESRNEFESERGKRQATWSAFVKETDIFNAILRGVRKL